jgi:hypothetical protein
MPKFYITDKVEETVVDAPTSLKACIDAVRFRFHGIPVDGFYKVSEIGFEEHDEDIIFKASEIVEIIIEIMDDETKDEDWG